MTDIPTHLAVFAKEHCSSVCTILYGYPPCYDIGPWPNEECDDPICRALADAMTAAQKTGAEND